MANRRRKKKANGEAEDLRPTMCTDCGGITTGGGACGPCIQRIRVEAEAEANPPPPPPEPPPEIKERIIRAPGGCIRCGSKVDGLLCGLCSSELHGLPRREGDPVIKFPKPLTICGY